MQLDPRPFQKKNNTSVHLSQHGESLSHLLEKSWPGMQVNPTPRTTSPTPPTRVEPHPPKAQTRNPKLRLWDFLVCTMVGTLKDRGFRVRGFRVQRFGCKRIETRCHLDLMGVNTGTFKALKREQAKTVPPRILDYHVRVMVWGYRSLVPYSALKVKPWDP